MYHIIKSVSYKQRKFYNLHQRKQDENFYLSYLRILIYIDLSIIIFILLQFQIFITYKYLLRL